MKNYLTLNYFHIKVIIDEYDYVYIDIYPHYTIKEVKDIINKKQGKITPKYVQVYKGDTLLDETRKVKSYNITKNDTLSIKSSRKGEFLVYFWCNERTVGKYVKKEDNINEAFNYVKFKFEDYYFNSKDEAFLIYDCCQIKDRYNTFESENISEKSKIIVQRQIYG